MFIGILDGMWWVIGIVVVWGLGAIPLAVLFGSAARLKDERELPRDDRVAWWSSVDSTTSRALQHGA
jgi:hypothetical protein